jgi:Flp pilus assembly protein TadG
MMRFTWDIRNKRRRGVVAVFVAVCLTALVGVVAIAIDGGMLYDQLRRGRATADAAAMAAAADLFQNYPANQGTDPSGTAQAAALSLAAANGYANDGVNSTVTVNIPPASGIYAGQASYAEVIVTYNVQRGFSRIWSNATIPVTARSVARGAWVSPKAGVLVLAYQGKGTLNCQGNGSFTETGGPVIVNTNNLSGLVDTGNGTMYGPEFDITGGASLGGGASLITTPVPGQVYTGVHPTPDPLAYLPPPSVPLDGTMTVTPLGGGGTQYVLSPGRYTNLPTFTSGDVVILQQASANNAGGVFYIDGGGFKSTGASITMDPNTTGGVMIYNQPASTSDSEKIQITGNGSGQVNLSPLTSGPYTGMMLWQDRTSPVPILVEGNGNFTINGTFYAAGAMLNIHGNGKTSTGTATGSYIDDSGAVVSGASRIGSQYISQDLSLGGNGNINIHYQGPPEAKTRVIALVE